MGEFTRRPAPARPKRPDSGGTAPGPAQVTTPAMPIWSALPALHLTVSPGQPVIQRLAIGAPLPNLANRVAAKYDAENRPVDIAEEIPEARTLIASDPDWQTFVRTTLTSEQGDALHNFLTAQLPGANVNAGLEGLRTAWKARKRFTGAQRVILDRLEGRSAGTNPGAVIRQSWDAVANGIAGEDDVLTWLYEQTAYSMDNELDAQAWQTLKTNFLDEPFIVDSVLDRLRDHVKTQKAAKVRTAKLNAMKMDQVRITAPPSTGDKEGRRDNAKLVKRLLQLDLVKTLVGRPVARPQQQQQAPKEAEWRGKGKPALRLMPPKPTLTLDGLKKDVVKQKAEDADKKVRQMVAPEVLATIPPPPIRAYPHSDADFRAFCDADAVHVAHHDDVNIFVHEMGHWIEDRLPVEKWFNIQAMLRKRHEWAGGGDNSVAGLWGADSLMGRFAGNYGTGNYTSKIYETTGATEVVSKTLEQLTKPTDAMALVASDPVLVATVLMQVNPGAFDQETRTFFLQYVHNA
ncbi:MAG TPA: hypothetical protein VNT75_11900 [Symbiobacteriaceae bacterium]|nr:hypothetical protein [Symbiobacteriaceae bacterium]